MKLNLASIFYPSISRLTLAFFCSVKGNVALMFALVFPVLILAGGFTIDYSNAARVKGQLASAADTAALSATSRQAVIEYSQLGDHGQSKARAYFNSQVQLIKNVSVSALTVTVSQVNGALVAQVDCTGTVTNAFARIFGMARTNVHCHAVSSTRVPSYIDFYLLLDNSPSMGVAATPADLATMVGATPDQCGFACHEKNPDGSDNMNDYYHLAKARNVQTKIDTLRAATQQLTQTAALPAYNIFGNQYRMGVYTFSNAFQTISGLTSNLSGVGAAAAAIDLAYADTTSATPFTQTSFDTALAQMNTQMTNPGNGWSAAQPKKFLFFVTDGVEDEVSAPYGKIANVSNYRIIDLINSGHCDTIKARNIDIAVLYTVYQNLPTNAFYNTYVAPINAQTGPNQIIDSLKACASPNFFFSVTPTQGIPQAMDAMFKAAVLSSTLTQ